jgi:hypothetical protein
MHAISVTHTKFADDAAGWMLNFFHIRIDDDGSGGDNRPRDYGRCRPTADAND